MRVVLGLLALGLLLPELSLSLDPPLQFDFTSEPSLESLRATKFMVVKPEVTKHEVEQRGFVSVPMDYSRREISPTLNIFYRLMPRNGTKVGDSKAPLLVVINGGPGKSSAGYRVYDYDYDHPTEKMRSKDQLGELLNYFRVLILDQRGTSGYSAPLDLGDRNLNPVVVARYFDSYHIALDYQEVINAVVPQDESFFMIAQSYGGKIGMRYLTLEQVTRHPKGIIFSSSALPHENPVKMMASRRLSQMKLNNELRLAVPGIDRMFKDLSEHFRANGLRPESVNYLWSLLGKGPSGVWEQVLKKKVETLLIADKTELQAFLDQEAPTADILNYILSSKELTAGYTDRTIGPVVVSQVPFEKWMVDEQWTLSQIKGDVECVNPLLDALDRKPPSLWPKFPSLEELRQKLARQNVLFTIGQGDAYLEEDATRAHAENFVVTGRGSIKTLPGGHKAAFLKDGARAITSWVEQLP